MSMIKCDRCERVLDAKDEGLNGAYGDDAPYEYLCPDCVDSIACDLNIDYDTEESLQVIIQEWRRRLRAYAIEDAWKDNLKSMRPDSVTLQIEAVLDDTQRINKAFGALLDACLECYGDLPLPVMAEVARCCQRVSQPLACQQARPDLDEYGDKLR